MTGGSGGRRFEFRLLGPLEVVSEGAVLPVGGPRQRALFVFLLLHANRSVRRATLIDALWGDEPPARAQNALQVAIHGLRKLLGAERIATVGDGYRLHVQPGELDLARFLELREQAPAHALDVWRGPALADVDAPFAEAEASRLEELRLGALEARIESELAGGAHELLVPELEQQIAEHPFRERLRGQLMLALYRAGRQAEALEAYQAARHVLVEELGIDPSPELQRLEQRILRQDPALSPLVVADLPAATSSFIGRELELAALSALLAPGVRLVTLTGAGGTGKTRLALELAARLPGQAAFVDLAPLAAADLVPSAIASALDVPERDARPLLEDLKEHLRHRRLLLLLDNFEHLLAAAPVLGELQRAAPSLTLLVTSRAALRVSGEHEYVVPPLAEREAIELFAERARAVDADFAIDDGADAVAAICRRLDSLPLAIELAAARTKLFTPEALLARLEQRLPLLTRAGDAPERQRTLRATLDWSHDLLPPAEQRLFRRLGVFAGGFDVAAAEAVCEADLEELSTLVDQSLVWRPRPDRLALLQTVREYALERLVESGEEDRVRRAHAQHFLALAEESAEVMYGGDQAGWWARLESHHDDLRAALTWSAASGEGELELRLATALWAFWSAHGHLREGRRWLDDALERTRGGRVELRANALACAGALAYRQGDWDYTTGRFEEAFTLYRSLGDELGTARMLGELGNLAVARGDNTTALARYEEAAALLRALGEEGRVAQVIANMGSVASIEREYDRARTLFEEALTLQRELGNREAGTISLHNLGRVELALGKLDEAASWFSEALQDAVELGYRELIAYCLEAFGELALAHDELERGARLLGAATALFDELGLALAPDEAETYEQARVTLRERLGDERSDTEWSAGAATPLDDAIAVALATTRASATSE